MSLRGQDKQTENNNTINNGNWQQKQKTINRDLCHGSGSCSEKSKNNQRVLAYQNATHNAQRVSELQSLSLSLSLFLPPLTKQIVHDFVTGFRVMSAAISNEW